MPHLQQYSASACSMEDWLKLVQEGMTIAPRPAVTPPLTTGHPVGWRVKLARGLQRWAVRLSKWSWRLLATEALRKMEEA